MGQKFPLADAIEQFSDSEIWSRFVKAETACRKKGWVYHRFGESVLFLDKPPRGYHVLEARRSQAWAALYNPFISKLQIGTLIATGFLYPAEPPAHEISIPAARWFFLRPLFNSNEAQGGDFRFVGIRVGLYPDTKKPRRGKSEAPFWPEARKVAIAWLVDEGCPAPGDGNQAKLEQLIANWLTGCGHNAAEPTIRRHVSKWIAERREELGV